MPNLSEQIRSTLANRIPVIESRLSETREWLEKLDSIGFNVNDAKAKQIKAENILQRIQEL